MISISIHLVCDECPDAMLRQFGSSTKSSKLHADAERNYVHIKMRTCQFGAEAFKAASKQISTKEKKLVKTPGCFQNKHPKLLLAGWPQTTSQSLKFRSYKRPPCWPNDHEIDGTFHEPKAWKVRFTVLGRCDPNGVQNHRLTPWNLGAPIWVHRGHNFYQWSDFINPKLRMDIRKKCSICWFTFLLAVQEVHLKPSWGYEQSGNIDELIGCFSTWFPESISIQWLSLGVLPHIQQFFAWSLWFWDILDSSLLDIRIFEKKQPFLRFFKSHLHPPPLSQLKGTHGCAHTEPLHRTLDIEMI